MSSLLQARSVWLDQLVFSEASSSSLNDETIPCTRVRTFFSQPLKLWPSASRSISRACSWAAWSAGSRSSSVTGVGVWAVALTASTMSALTETVGMIGSGFSSPPSTSTWPLSWTGVMMPGTAIEARIARSSGPLWNHTSRWRLRSVATAVNGIGRSSIRISPTSASSLVITLPARMAPMALQVMSTRRNTSK